MAARDAARRHAPRCWSPTRCRSASSSIPPCTIRRSREALTAADKENIRGKAVTPFLLAYMQRATEGESVAVNLDVARGNIALAAEIATAWSALPAGAAKA